VLEVRGIWPIDNRPQDAILPHIAASRKQCRKLAAFGRLPIGRRLSTCPTFGSATCLRRQENRRGARKDKNVVVHSGKPQTVSKASGIWPIANRPQDAILPHNKIVAARGKTRML
jgi:hypothetical protein